ncbi:MAG: DUF2214 family protein [Cyclobacteriaceae bacterium]
MTEFIIVKYLHFLGIFGVVGTLLIELFYVKSSMSRAQISRISKIDGIYGLSAIIVLFAGLTMWFWVGKPAELYSKNWIFHTKVTLFIAVGILSIFPTVFFLKQRKGSPGDEINIPSKIINMIRLEVFLLFIIPLLAVLMANGIGGF